MARRRIRLLREGHAGRPAFDTAVSRALLHRAGLGEEPESLRLYRPDAIVAFGRRDVTAPGYLEAVREARARGFEAVQRLAGGRAAVFHEKTLAFAWATPDASARERIHDRFDAIAELMAAAFQRLGVDARVGEVPGEYCPGAHSVNAGGKRKLMGVGQRVLARAAHVGGVVVVGSSDRVRDVLVPVYRALGLDWRPETAGSLADELGDCPVERAEAAILAELEARFELEEGSIGGATLELAASLERDHVSPD
jgi:octanoyl-[GcvH]:protein N-octanoyltransferase